MKKFYVELHKNGRPADNVVEESHVDLENHIIAGQHECVGEYKSRGDAIDAYWEMVEPDDRGFYQWK